ncbi:MAG: acyl-CoA dehydrogenase family protein [Thermodesulfobacteriota bacterium]
MDIRLTEEQVEMARQARRFCENEAPPSYVRAMFDDERGYKDQVWKKMVEMGWPAMLAPEVFGGLGLGLLDLTLVLEEMGRAVLPGPFFSTVLLAGAAILEAGSLKQKESYLPRLAAGEMMGTLALHEPEGGPDPEYIRMEARPTGRDYLVSGAKLFVPDAQVADFLVLAARTASVPDLESSVTLFLVDSKTEGVSISVLPTLDGSRKLSAVELRNVRLSADDVLGEVNRGWAPLKRVRQRAGIGLAAESLGAAQKAMETATEYAKVRVQFDQPIGAFQAVKHQCAQMYLQMESSRSLLYWSAWAQDQASSEEAELAAAAAKSYVGEMARQVCSSAIQVLGGIGFTWEHDLHLYLKRTLGNESALGDPIYHREQAMRLIERG